VCEEAAPWKEAAESGAPAAEEGFAESVNYGKAKPTTSVVAGGLGFASPASCLPALSSKVLHIGAWINYELMKSQKVHTQDGRQEEGAAVATAGSALPSKGW
jgi:hypothetical protein